MRRRQLTATLLVVVVAICILGVPLLYLAAHTVSSDARTGLLREADTVATLVEDHVSAGDLTTPMLGRIAPANRRVVVGLPGGRVLSAGANVGADPYTARVSLPGGGWVRVERTAAEIRDRQLRAGLVVAGLAVLAIGSAVLLAIRSARRLSGPLLQLAGHAERLGAGNFQPAGRRYGVPELDRVAEVLDTTAVQIAELVRRERELVADISHQLRSRLTALTIRLEEVAARSTDPVAKQEGTAALEQAHRLAGVIDELLAQARQERLQSAHPVEVAGELATLHREWDPALRAAGRALRVDRPAGLRAVATPGRLNQALSVLVENALKHGAGTVRVSVRSAEQHVVLQVTDEGAGVPPELAKRIFDRGVSGSGGTGLGLALARALVDADGGRLELRRARPATFAVYLRRADVEGAAGSVAAAGPTMSDDAAPVAASRAGSGGPSDSDSSGSRSAASRSSARNTQRL